MSCFGLIGVWRAIGQVWMWRQGAETNPTHGRQGKRPAFGAAYVVGKIEEFTNVADTRCWRFLQIVQAFQGFERRRSELPRGAAS